MTDITTNTTNQRVVPERFDELLATRALAHVATIGPKGEPQSSPVWFTWDGDRVRIGLGAGRQKFVNLQRDGRVAVSMTHPEDPSNYLEIRGRVVSMEPDQGGRFTAQIAPPGTSASTRCLVARRTSM
ncbi:MAG TPA: PPOX class F420-dependent oxidoreductase [Thermomicrobiales bacterium]|jgi:hypothetical protein|nr:PPOX class F420-dependent oxidoreductase [Thermomicrobiales bacterium]